MAVQHTQQPATIDPDLPDIINFGDPYGDRYAGVVPRMETDAEDLANAERIKLCWNAHDDLLASLKVMVSAHKCGVRLTEDEKERAELAIHKAEASK